MTLNGAIRQLAEMRDSEYMPILFKPLFDKVIETVSECEEPAADVATIRHGRWVIYKAPDAYHCGLVKCPFCGEEMIAESDEYNFCPNCGAKMDGGDSK